MSIRSNSTLAAPSTTHSKSPFKADRDTRRSIRASTVGNILEWFEWSTYAVFAPFIAAVMFNPDDPVSGLLSTLAVFAVGFLARPLGGMVFGRIADRRGRKFVLMTTMLLMAGGSFFIGVMPTYATVGVWASVMLLAARLLQGFAHGGESAAANTYVAEIAPAARRGMWSSIPFIAIFAGSVLAYTLGGVLTSVLDDETVTDWGWRIPFLMGGLLALVVLWMRRGMIESEVFEDGTTPTKVESPARNGVNPDPAKRYSLAKSIVLIIAMTAGITAAHYTWSSYVSTYAIAQQGMSPSSAYWAVVVAQAVALISLPFWGRLSDRVGRKPLLVGFAGLMIATQMPLMNMIDHRPWTLLIAATAALLIVSIAGALLSAVMSESFPTTFRTQGIGFAYSLSVAVFGGFAPYINEQVIAWGLDWLSSVYIILLCIATLVATSLLPSNTGVDLSKVK